VKLESSATGRARALPIGQRKEIIECQRTETRRSRTARRARYVRGDLGSARSGSRGIDAFEVRISVVIAKATIEGGGDSDPFQPIRSLKPPQPRSAVDAFFLPEGDNNLQAFSKRSLVAAAKAPDQDP